MTLAKALTAADPIMLHMMDKVTKDEAAKKIVEMARKAGIQAKDMYAALYVQYQMELGSFTRDEVKKGTIGADGGRPLGGSTPYGGEADLIGELSLGHFEDILPLNSQGKVKWGAGGSASQLRFTANAKAKLQALKAAVVAMAQDPIAATPPTINRPSVPGWDRLSNAQKSRLEGVEQTEAATMAGGGAAGIRGEINQALQSIYEILPP